MTKNQEIETLQAFIETLPEASYLRPWLTDILPDIQREIACDFIPAISPTILREEAEKRRAKFAAYVTECKAEILRQNEAAQTEAKRIIAEAQKRADQIERNAKTKLAEGIARLQYALSALQ